MTKPLKYILAFLLIAAVSFSQEVEVVNLQDDQFIRHDINFDGAWLPDYDGAEIGPNNFQTLVNLRYSERHPEGVQGYSKINSTALSTYTKIRSGIQLRTDRSVGSYIFVQAENSTETASQVFQNQTAVPSAGDFEGTALHTDGTGAGLGRFATNVGHVIYTNEVESRIWAGEESRLGGVFTLDDASYTNPVEWTEEANNTLSDSDNVFTVDNAGQEFWIFFTTRPAQGFTYTIETANATAGAATTVKFWDGDSFDAVSNLSDGTISGGISLAQDGEMSFDLPAVKPFHLEGVYLYAYLMEIDAGSATISNVVADIPWQAMVDVWDGRYRQPIQFQYQDDVNWEDYTLDVNYPATTAETIAADISALTAADDEIVIGFEERMSGIRIEMLEGGVNENASVVTVKYWDGDSWSTVGTSKRDGTDTGGDTLSKTGLISWSPEVFTDERSVTKFGVKGYFYQLTFNNDLSATVKVDLVTGIPAQIEVKPFKFPSRYKNRTFLAGYMAGKEGNRVDYSMTNAPDVFNGDESSNDGLQSLYFGGSSELTAGVELYNRYGSNVFSMWVALKKGATFVLTGDGPEDFKIYPISYNIGCPAPLTLATAEVGYEMAEGVVRNVAIWLSYSGVVIFDGAVITPVRGIDSWFDVNQTESINFDYIDKSVGWYDAAFKEYNILIPVGPYQKLPNKWLVYDVGKKKWFEKDSGSSEMPKTAFSVQDAAGAKYSYAGVDTGYLMRLENGYTWDGEGIRQKLTTGEIWPSGSKWDITRIRHFKYYGVRISQPHNMDVFHIPDSGLAEGADTSWSDTGATVFKDTSATVWSGGGDPAFRIDISSGAARVMRSTKNVNWEGWSHAFRLDVVTDDSVKGFQPIGISLLSQVVREDL